MSSAGHLTAPPAASPTVVRVERQEGTVSLQVDWDALPPPSQTFAADMAFAQERHGSPELVFVQTSPLDMERAVRVVAVRYAFDQFITRTENNREFRQQLEQHLDQTKPGWSTSPPQRPTCPEGIATLTVDADFEVIVRTGGHAAIIPVTAPSWNRYRVVMGQRNDLQIQPVVEITLPIAALGHLLQSWDELARQLAGSRDA